MIKCVGCHGEYDILANVKQPFDRYSKSVEFIDPTQKPVGLHDKRGNSLGIFHNEECYEKNATPAQREIRAIWKAIWAVNEEYQRTGKVSRPRTVDEIAQDARKAEADSRKVAADARFARDKERDDEKARQLALRAKMRADIEEAKRKATEERQARSKERHEAAEKVKLELARIKLETAKARKK